jgi:uncharacterized membrane protein YukC
MTPFIKITIMLKQPNRKLDKHRKRSNYIIMTVVGVGFAILLVLGIYMLRYLKNVEEQKTEPTQIESSQ